MKCVWAIDFTHIYTFPQLTIADDSIRRGQPDWS